MRYCLVNSFYPQPVEIFCASPSPVSERTPVMKKLISLLLTGLMCANLTAPALAAEDTADTAAPGQTAITFTDMPSSPEFVESITWAVENGITTGMYDGQFWPDYTCNISQILTFIWRMSGSPEPAGEN